MKKVLHIPNYYNPHIGGIEQTAEDIVDSLKGITENKVICFNGDKKTSFDEVNGVSVTRCGKKITILSQGIAPDYNKNLKKIFKEYKPDYVIFHYPNPFVSHYLLKYLKKNKQIKFILWWHSDIVKQKLVRKLFEGQNKKLLKRADTIIATSPNYVLGSKYLTTYKDKVHVIPSSVGVHQANIDVVNNKINEIKENNKGKKIIFALGRHVKYKGIEHLVKASKYIPDDYMIYIGGKGPLTDELMEMSKNDFKITFLGKMKNEDLEAYLSACDVFAFPSVTKNEAFGLALAEAMLHHKPAVTFTIPGSGVNYVNLNGETGIEVANGDEKAFAEAIIKIASNDDLKNTYGENAYNRVMTLFSKDAFKKEVIKLFN